LKTKADTARLSRNASITILKWNSMVLESQTHRDRSNGCAFPPKKDEDRLEEKKADADFLGRNLRSRALGSELSGTGRGWYEGG
jgi:hypothetical protein